MMRGANHRKAAMALSEYEQKMLEQLEAQLKDEDPKLAESFQVAPPNVSLKNLVFGCLITVAGLGLIVWGVSAGWMWLGVIGFVVALAGVLFATMGGKGDGDSDRPARPAPRSSTGPGQSFMQRQADKWEQRRDQGF